MASLLEPESRVVKEGYLAAASPLLQPALVVLLISTAAPATVAMHSVGPTPSAMTSP